MPFHVGWELVEWRPTISVSEWLETEFDRICDEIEEEDSVEVPGVVPTVEVEEEDSSVEFLISRKEMKRDQAEGTGAMPVPEDAELRREG